MHRFHSLLALLTVSAGLILAQTGQSPLPELPADVPKDAVLRMLVTDKIASGQDAVWKTPDGTIHEFFQFNDRGRGPKIYTTYRLDAAGQIVSEESKGVDYMKSPVAERFTRTGGDAAWKNQAEDEKVENAAGKFYVDLNGGPESAAILARALLHPKTGGKLPVLPSGTARIRKVRTLSVAHKLAALYEITGLGFTPNYIWLDENHQLLASIGAGWAAVIRHGFESSEPGLRSAQQEVEAARGAELAKTLAHKPAGDLVIRHVTVFDAASGNSSPDQRVTIHGKRIASVETDSGEAVASGATEMDGAGKVLLPGLWDMHAHLYAENAFLDMATGVTTARDLGNSIEDLTRLRQGIDGGTQIGPRVVRAGFIDGPGPFEGPIKILAATPEEAKVRVDHYADLGYVQIKIYSSVNPELVPVIVAEAHRRGLRVSGHVPSGMTAEQFVRDGCDEIQHMNFIFLNFMPDVKETRTPARFIEPGKRGGALDLDSPAVNDFVTLLKEQHIVIDPTMGVWEGTYLDRPGTPARIDLPLFDRLPVQVQRGSKTGGGALAAADPATDKLYRDSYANMLRMLKKLYDSGVQIVAGTDAGSGYAFDRELEIYVEAGIPAPEVLRIATLQAAKVMHMDGDLGLVASGKLADLILVNGDPMNNISDIRKVDTVIKDGVVYQPAEMYPAFGMRAE